MVHEEIRISTLKNLHLEFVILSASTLSSENIHTAMPGGVPIKDGDTTLGGIGLSSCIPERDHLSVIAKPLKTGILFIYHHDSGSVFLRLVPSFFLLRSIASTMRFHRDDEKCLELLALNGHPKIIRDLSKPLVSTADTKY